MKIVRVRAGAALPLALVAGLAFGLVRPALAAEMDHATIALPAITFAFAPVYIAQDEGFWAKRGLEVKSPVITGIGAMNAVSASRTWTRGRSTTRSRRPGAGRPRR